MASDPRDDQISVLPLEPSPEDIAKPVVEQHSYSQILKSSVLVGGSSVVNIAFGIVRTKAMAILLGPGGFGLFGIYGSIVTLAQNIAGMGVNSSGVRQIAEAVASDDAERIGQTSSVLVRTSTALGALGAIFLIIFSKQVSALTFGNKQHASAISLLSIAVFFQLVANGQGSLIQGMRRIADLAKIASFGAIFGTVISILVVYFLRDKGVAPSLVCVALMSLIVSWWYSRKIPLQYSRPSSSIATREALALLKLGLAFMASALMTMGIAYAVRIILLRRFGIEATGYYQSAWTLGGLYVGFILQAMAADFYPRLTASAANDSECNRLVNEQARVGLLLAGPGVIATLSFAPIVITLFYSAQFYAAVGVLRWICLGTTLQVITWPMSFVIVAKGRQVLFFFTELAWAVVSLALALFCVRLFGLNGAGIAFFGSYVFYGFLLWIVVNRLSGFNWSRANQLTGLLFLSLIAAVFCGFYILPLALAASLGGLAALLSTIYSMRVLSTFISLEQIPVRFKGILIPLLRFLGASSAT